MTLCGQQFPRDTRVRQLTAGDLAAFLARPAPPVGLLVRVLDRAGGRTLVEAVEFPEWGAPRGWVDDADLRDVGPAEVEYRRRHPTRWEDRFAGCRWVEVRHAAYVEFRKQK